VESNRYKHTENGLPPVENAIVLRQSCNIAPHFFVLGGSRGSAMATRRDERTNLVCSAYRNADSRSDKDGIAAL
jgi:hypothetical protein